MADYRPNVEAWEHAMTRLTSSREIWAAIVTVALTLGALALAGQSKDIEAMAIGAACALFVGLILMPGAAFVNKRLTAHRRFLRAQTGEMVAALAAISASVEPATETERRLQMAKLEQLEKVRSEVERWHDPLVGLGVNKWDNMHDQQWRSWASRLDAELEQCRTWCDLPVTSLIPEQLRGHAPNEAVINGSMKELATEIDKLMPSRWSGGGPTPPSRVVSPKADT